MPRSHENGADASRHGDLALAVRIGLVLAAIVTALDWLGVSLDGPFEFLFDYKAALLSQQVERQRSDIAVLYFDDSSLSGFPYKTPIHRGLLARVLKEVDESSPKSVGIDIIFDKQTEASPDRELINTVREMASPVVVVRTGATESGVEKAALSVQEAFLKGFGRPSASPFMAIDKSVWSNGDGVVRRLPSADETVQPPSEPFALALARSAGIELPSLQGELIDWLRPGRNGTDVFLTLTVPLTTPGDDQPVLPDVVRRLLKDRIVIIGGKVAGQDWHSVPTTIVTGELMSGAEVHAQMLAQIIDRRAIGETGYVGKFMLVLLACLFMTLAHARLPAGLPDTLVEWGIAFLTLGIGLLCYWLIRVNIPEGVVAMAWLSFSLLSGSLAKRLS